MRTGARGSVFVFHFGIVLISTVCWFFVGVDGEKVTCRKVRRIYLPKCETVGLFSISGLCLAFIYISVHYLF